MHPENIKTEQNQGYCKWKNFGYPSQKYGVDVVVLEIHYGPN